jgi:hypothetical protein
MNHGRHLLAALLAVAIATLLTGCDFSEPVLSYQYECILVVRQQGAATERISLTARLDRQDRAVALRTKSVSQGKETVVKVFDFEDCDVFDDTNFNCTKLFSADKLRMTDGKLVLVSDGHEIEFSRRLLFFGERL